MPEPWEQQEKEGKEAFEAFQIYRDMGVSRSLSAVAQQLNKSKTLMGRWSSDHNWVDRTREWDREQDRILRLQQIEDIKKMRKRHAALAVEMLEKALEGLRLLTPEELNAVSIGRIVEVASRLEQKSRGDTTDAVEMREAEEKASSPVMFFMPDNGRVKNVKITALPEDEKTE